TFRFECGFGLRPERVLVTEVDDLHHCIRETVVSCSRPYRVLEYRPCPPTHGWWVLRQRAGKGRFLGRALAHTQVRVFVVSESRSGSWLQAPAQPAKTISLDDIYHGAKISGIGWRRGMALRRVRSTSPKLPQVSS